MLDDQIEDFTPSHQRFLERNLMIIEANVRRDYGICLQNTSVFVRDSRLSSFVDIASLCHFSRSNRSTPGNSAEYQHSGEASGATSVQYAIRDCVNCKLLGSEGGSLIELLTRNRYMYTDSGSDASKAFDAEDVLFSHPKTLQLVETDNLSSSNSLIQNIPASSTHNNDEANAGDECNPIPTIKKIRPPRDLTKSPSEPPSEFELSNNTDSLLRTISHYSDSVSSPKPSSDNVVAMSPYLLELSGKATLNLLDPQDKKDSSKGSSINVAHVIRNFMKSGEAEGKNQPAANDNIIEIEMIELGNNLPEHMQSARQFCSRKEFSINVICLVVIALSAFFFNFVAFPKTDPGRTASVTLTDLLAGRYAIDPPNSTWHHDALLYRNGEGDLVLFNATTARQTILIDRYQHSLNTSHSQQLSANGKFVLFTTFNGDRSTNEFSTNGLWTNDSTFGSSNNGSSTNNTLACYTVQTVNIDSQSQQSDQIVVEPTHWQYATFGPRHSQFVYVSANNVYYKPNVTKPSVQLTVTGSLERDPYVINGLMHPAYRRDIFVDQPAAMWFSSHGQYLAIAEFSDSRNEPFVPAVNETLPLVRVRIANLDASKRTGPIWRNCAPVRSPPDDPSVLLLAVAWASVPGYAALLVPQRVVVVWSNRLRTKSYVQACMAQTGAGLLLVGNIETRMSWPSTAPRPVWLDDQFAGELVVLQPSPTTRFDVMRAYPSEPTSGSINYGADNSRVLHMDELNVQRILHWDTPSHVLFCLANTVDVPEVSQLYAVIRRPNVLPYGQCLTCHLFDDKYTQFDARFSGVGNFLWLGSLGPAVPRYDVYQWTERNLSVSIQHAHTMREFAALRQRIALIGEPVVLQHTVIINDVQIHIRLTYPPEYAGRQMEKKYALLVVPYAGPGTFVGSTAWRLEWPEYMVLERNIMVLRLDARGSGRRGTYYANSVIENLGQAEALDIINVVRLLLDIGNFQIDENHIGIWGTEYGGLVAGLALTIGARKNMLRCGAAVEPLAELQMHTALFTERFMGFPNAEGFANASLLKQASKIPDNALLLVHGGSRVNRQMSKGWATALEVADVRFEQYGGRDRFGQHQVLEKFFERCLCARC